MPLRISTLSFGAGQSGRSVLDMNGRCGFAICTMGLCKIRILNELYEVTEGSIIACMPFVNIDIIDVSKPCELITGFLSLSDLPSMINRWIDTKNLLAVQNHPVVKMVPGELRSIRLWIDEYLRSEKDYHDEEANTMYARIESDIIDFRCKLIVAGVLKIFYSRIRLEARGHTHRDLIFQRFIMSLYNNFREHRDVDFYASGSGVSRKYFSTVIREISGVSPSEWIKMVVVGEAKSLLADNQMSIKEIATALNFPDAPTFTKYFMRIAGLTPRAFRKSTL